MKKILLLGLMLFQMFTVSGQVFEKENHMFWAFAGIQKDIGEKFSIGYDQLHSYDINERGFNFIQSNLQFSYRPVRAWTFSVSYEPTLKINDDPNDQLIYHRISGEIRLYTRISGSIRMNNAINAEQNFTQGSKYQQRYYYRLDLYYRNTSLPWRLRPYITQRLYLYNNGRLLQYYDEEGEKLDLKSPDGLHAYRVYAGIRFYPTSNFRFSLLFMRQVEFNTKLLGSRDIHSLNPNTNSIRRSFNNFSVFGIMLSADI
ncbi:MAG: hypothetical protein R6W78_19540 [Bacteroidales bacterium]